MRCNPLCSLWPLKTNNVQKRNLLMHQLQIVFFSYTMIADDELEYDGGGRDMRFMA